MLVIVAVLAATGWWWTLHVVPPLDGRIPVRGLHAPVAVRFDRFAIPHISATSDEDAWQTVGLLQARDRLWQMELYRRVASGRLSEVLGDATVAIDRRFLTLGLRRAAEIEWQRTSPSVRTAFESYARGVNAAMAVGQGRLPLELQLLRVRPEPWTPIDSLAIEKLFAWRLGANHTAELLRYELAQSLGDRAQALLPGPPDWAPTILDDRPSSIVHRPSSIVHRPSSIVHRPSSIVHRPSSIVHRPSSSPGRHAVFAEVKSAAPLTHGRPTIDPPSRSALRRAGDRRSPIDDGRSPFPPGLEWLSSDAGALSNSWVVSGARTSSGRPLLANDPHLMIEMPSVWWEAHITGATVNVAGVTIPGIPFVVIGHNERIGWGLTNVGADVQDFFLEQLDPPRQKYLEGDTWVPLDSTRYAIRVSGRDRPVEFDVRSTRHGPVLNAADWYDPLPGIAADPQPVEQLDQTVLALKWPVVEGESAAAFDALARAGNWDDFIAATRQFSAPSQNFVYADVDGNIGYAMSGLLPLRSAGDGSMPTPGWLSDADWAGLIGGDQLPVTLNPPTGQIVTANNEVSRNLPFNITRDWVAPFRAARIIEMLGNRGGLDISAMERMQADITSLSANFLLTALGDAVPDELREWDRVADGRSTPALFAAFEDAMWRRTFADEMTDVQYGRFYRYAANERFAGLRAIIADATSPWFDDRSTPGVRETRDDIARMAAVDAVALLRERYGDPSRWRWNEIHAVKFGHALSGGGRLLDWIFSRGPVPVGGDNMTVNKTTTNLRRPYETSEAASYRQILDVGAWDASVGVNTTGQSGHPRSAHYFDQNALWRQGDYHPLPFTRRAVEAATVSLLELVPTGN